MDIGTTAAGKSEFSAHSKDLSQRLKPGCRPRRLLEAADADHNLAAQSEPYDAYLRHDCRTASVHGLHLFAVMLRD